MIEKAIKYIKSIDDKTYDYAVVLGSGWDKVAEILDVKYEINYSDIPGYPTCSVQGHKGKMLLGEIDGKKVILLMGRFHLYEGYTVEQVTFPIRVVHALGVKTIILTNASGAINKQFKPGDIMIITDHINFAYQNPLIGVKATEEYPIFIDMSTTYTPTLIQLAEKASKLNNTSCHKGVYLQTTGPTYETPAEIQAFKALGADVVGMSTVPEAILAHYLKMNVLGLACITNMASGISKTPLTHQEVLDIANSNKQKLCDLLRSIINLL